MKNKIDIEKPFIVGVVCLLAACLVTPDAPFRDSPLFWAFVVCFGYGLWNVWQSTSTTD